MLFTVPAGLVLGILLAVAANRRLRGIKVFQTIFASTVATSVAVASVVFFVLINPQIGCFQTVDWLQPADPDAALFGVSLSSIWQNLGLTFIIVLAGLQAVPDELMEAATLDGYGPVRRFFRVTLPLHLAGAAVPRRRARRSSRSRPSPRSTSSPRAGPAGPPRRSSTRSSSARRPTDSGAGSVMALGLFVVTFVVTLGQFVILDRRVHYGD